MGLLQSIADLFSRLLNANSRSADPRHLLGARGERIAARQLRREGFKVLYRNYRAKGGGEVDIVCRDKRENALVFIEVKTRSSDSFAPPSAAVDADKRRLIIRGAMSWLQLLDNPEVSFRFDIMEVVITADGPRCNLIRDAFHLPRDYR